MLLALHRHAHPQETPEHCPPTEPLSPRGRPLTLSWFSFSRSLSMTAEVPMALSSRRCSDRRSESTRLVPWEKQDVGKGQEKPWEEMPAGQGAGQGLT